MFVALRRIHVAASDFSRSRRFYSEILGLPETGGFEQDWVEFGLGPVLVKLTRLRPGEVPARNQVAAVLSTNAIDDAVSRLKERGVTVTRGPAEEFTGRSAEILDPDGYRLVIFQSSDLHPDEEWVPASHVDDLLRQRLLAARQKDRARAATKPAPKPAPRVAARKPTPKKAAPKGQAPKKLSRKKPAVKKASKKK